MTSSPPMTVELHMRQAVAHDLSLLESLVAAFYAEEHVIYDPARLRSTLQLILDRPDEAVLLLFSSEGETVGFATLNFPLSLEAGGRRSYLEDFFIEPAHRNRGFGNLAMDQMEQLARDRGAPLFCLENLVTNPKAQRFYERRGYQSAGRNLYWRNLDSAPDLA